MISIGTEIKKIVSSDMGYIEQLIENCEQAKLKKSKPSNVMSNISDLDGVKNAIYIIEEIGGNAEQTFSRFKEFKKTSNRKCAKANKPCNVMYVGSSITGLKTRIRQHMGCLSPNTYSLHLKHWFKGEYCITYKEFDVSKQVLQIIEDDLSYELSPAFGKLGGNSR